MMQANGIGIIKPRIHLYTRLWKGGFFMRRPCRNLGYYIAGAGLLLIVAVIIPCEFWWLFLGLALILVGILLCKC